MSPISSAPSDPARGPGPTRAALSCLLLTGLLAVAGCARTPLIADHLGSVDAPRRVELASVPFHPQEDYQCGPAALATVLEWSGQPVTADELVARVYLPARQGSLQPEIRATARRYDRLAYELEPRLHALLTELAAGHPVLVLQNLGFSRWPVWHYAVVVGFDADSQRFLLRSGTTAREVLSARRFLMSWARADAWALAVLPAGTVPASATVQRYASAAADLEATGSARAAVIVWEAGVARWPDTAITHFGLGNARYRQDDVAGAADAWRQVLDLEPTHVAARHNLARLYLQAGCHERARHQIAEARANLAHLPAMEQAVAAVESELADAGPDDGRCAFATGHGQTRAQ